MAASKAARITDGHSCPKVGPGTTPHVGGNISSGSGNVEINGLDAARRKDTAACATATDKIKKGALTVLVNGRQLARKDDPTEHGGVITGFSPNVEVGSVPAGCEYLDYPHTVEAPLANFDAIRSPATVGPAQTGTHTFPGNTQATPAQINNVQVNGRTVRVISPATVPAGTNVPSVQQVGNALGVVPAGQLGSIQQVVISPNANPSDAYWAQQYNIPNFTSQATGGNGGVTFYPTQTAYPQPNIDSTMIHEGAHTYSQTLWADPQKQAAWEAAIRADGQAPSVYAESSSAEDFAESLVMYALSRGTPCEAVVRAVYPNRHRALERLLHPRPRR